MRLTEEQIAAVRSLEDAEGRITPAAVVEEARKKASPLHALFEWDKNRAAMSHWLHQAREIIGAVTIVVTTTTATLKAPHYVRDPEAKGQGYRAVVSLQSNPDEARESLVYTLDVAAGHLRRAFDLASSLGLEHEIDELLARVAGVQRQIREAA